MVYWQIDGNVYRKSTGRVTMANQIVKFRGENCFSAACHQKSSGKKSQGSLGKPIDDARQNIAGLPDSGRSRPAAVVNTGLTRP